MFPNQIPTSQKHIHKSPQEQLPPGGFVFPLDKQAMEVVKVQTPLAFNNRLFLGRK